MPISRRTRLTILDGLSAERVAWWGRLDDVEFLDRVWDLDELPSSDHRFQEARGDIWQHRINNDDWEDDWLFDDGRFDLKGTSDEIFLAFLVETVHPNVRSDEAQVERLVSFYNRCLKRDGFEIVRSDSIPQLGGVERWIYEARPITGRRVSDVPLGDFQLLADRGALQEHLDRVDRTVESDPPTAISASKSLVESTLKLILDDFQVPYEKSDNLATLYKKVAKELSLNTEAVPEDAPASEAAHRALRSMSTCVQALAEVRNQLGADHGRTTSSKALTRHARLCASLSRGICEFLLETWHVRRDTEPTQS